MRKYLAFSLLLVFGCVLSAAGGVWEKRDSGVLAWLYAVEFLDGQTGFAAGSNGTLLATIDGGTHWIKLELPVSDTVRDIHFVDRSNGWLLCDRGRFDSSRNASYLLRTADAARTWSIVEFTGRSERFSRLFFSPNGTGYAVGEGGIMSGLPSEENAQLNGTLPVHFLMSDGTALDASTLVLVGGGGTVIVSNSAGRRWTAARFAGKRPTWKLNAVSFVDQRNGWIAGSRGSVYSTVDGGGLWRAGNSGTEADLLDIAFYDRNNGFAVGGAGIILRTGNAGATWTSDTSRSRHRLERLAFAGKRVVAVGFGGTILTTELP
ncbi:MAG: WD40/YVTN/BNR-like repeat-containing protein [Pyrinomonadaceae bacterium]